MGTLPEIIEEIIRADNSGIITDEQKLDNDYIESLVHEYRAQAIFMIYSNTKRLNPSWTQKCILEYDELIQESKEYVLFRAPRPLTLDPIRNGHIYVGSVCGTKPFRKVETRADLANRNMHRHMKVRDNIPKVLYSDLCYEVYGNTDIKTILVDGVHLYPTEVITYNKYKDPYPISGDLLDMMKSFVRKETSLSSNTPSDTRSDSTHTPTSISVK